VVREPGGRVDGRSVEPLRETRDLSGRACFCARQTGGRGRPDSGVSLGGVARIRIGLLDVLDSQRDGRGGLDPRDSLGDLRLRFVRGLGLGNCFIEAD